ncbi:hypothetical protein vseg_003865 [Gypsophila vaccaria]
MGSGHINPEKAVNPGLVYDIGPEDYITHLCSLRYSRPDIFTITRRNVSCSELLHKSKGFSLNYPSISVILRGTETVKIVNRRLTNVGSPKSVYSVKVKAPEGVRIVVKPKQLVFRSIKQSLNYRVYIIAKKRVGAKPVGFVQGELVWVQSQRNLHKVRSPITVSWVNRKS